MQIPANIQVLIEKYQSGTATEEELRQLNEWYHSFNDTEVDVTIQSNDTEGQLNERIKKRLLQTIHQEKPVVKKILPWRISAVAAALLIIATGIYFLFSNSKTSSDPIANKQTAKHTKQTEIKPGGNKAILTMANGSTIVLDTAANGMISDLGNVKIQKMQNGLLAYTVNGKQITENDVAFYNTIATPRGGQYQVTLTDGTKVWLNAASSIRFPIVFTGKERRVQITGEVYFEVSKNKNLPFRVQAPSGTEVEVLGTHFNVNAYADEASVKTTLLEGLVKVSASSSKNQLSKFIVPGQQASVNQAGIIDVKDHTDVEEAVAWKNGRFQFKSTDVRSILRQLSRWYDVDVVYRGNVNLHFTGQLSRNESVDTIFKKLELTGAIHFKTEGKTIIVSP